MDNSNVLALKYRPTKLADLVGQEAVITTLSNAFTAKNLYPCYIFAGNFGCGKTSAARILAAMENCEKGPTLEPCGTCKMCEEIFSGQSSDIKEVNAASANGIDDIRYIAEFVATNPLHARVKYVILDECHALSRQAVESALKVLEEPPEGVRFILCTTDANKLKGTIHSRATPFRFSKVPWQQITEHLKSVAAKEKIDADEGALKIAAKLSEGSVRNSLRNLQILITYANGKKITTEAAQIALGAVDDTNYFELVDSVLAKDPTSGMKIIQNIFSKGLDAEQVLAGLTDHLRTLMVLTSCNNTAGLLYLSDDEKKRYIHQIGRMTIYSVVEMLTLLHEINRSILYGVNVQTLFEEYLLKAIIAHARIERESDKSKKA